MKHQHTKPKNLHRWTYALIINVMLGATLTACGGKTVDMSEAMTAAMPLNNKNIPPDVKLAASAVLMKIKGFGDNSVDGVSFSAEAAKNTSVIGLDFDGFTLKGIAVINYEQSKRNTDLVALLLFEDAVGRRAGMRFLVEYQVAGKGINIQHASVAQVFADTPRIEAYVVPFDPDVDPDKISKNHRTLYTYAVNSAVPINRAPAGVGDYDVFVFIMDRSSSTAEVKGRISKNYTPTSGYEGATTMLDFNGWKVAIISGEMDPQSNETLYAKLLYASGKEAAWYNRFEKMRGLFGLTVKAQTESNLRPLDFRFIPRI